MARDATIDSLRGIALLLMVMVHAAATWQPEQTSTTGILAFFVAGFGGLAAPIFIVLVGWGVAKSRRNLQSIFIKVTILLTAQILVNKAGSHLFEPLTPGVLSLIAIIILSSSLWLPLTRIEYKKKPIWLIALVMMIILPAIISPGRLTWNAMVNTPDFETLLRHLLWDGTYPLFPWLAFAMVGARIHDLSHIEKGAGQLLGGGILLFLTWAIMSYVSSSQLAAPSGDAVMTFFPANLPFITTSLTCVGIIWIALSRSKKIPGLESLGRVTLTFYILHFIPLNLMYKLDETGNWSFTTSMMVTILYTLIWWPLAILHQEKIPNYSIESLIARVTKLKTIIP